jgi:hypothetical protein
VAKDLSGIGLGFEGVVIDSFARHAHCDVIGERVLGIAGAKAAFAESRNVVRA